MLDAFASLLCSTLCRHNWHKPTLNYLPGTETCVFQYVGETNIVKCAHLEIKTVLCYGCYSVWKHKSKTIAHVLYGYQYAKGFFLSEF